MTRLPDDIDWFRLMVESVRDYAIFRLDPQGRIRSWNPGAQAIKGYTAADVMGEHFSLFYPEEDKRNKKPQMELDVAMTQGRYEEEGWRVRKDGSLFWANILITAMRDERGTLRGFVKVTRDLTDRKQAEERLRESEDRFRMLMNAVEDYAIYMMDPQGYIRSWNAGAQRIKGYHEGEVIGQHFSMFYTDEDVRDGKPQQELDMARVQGRYAEEGWRVRKYGMRFWAAVVLTPIFGADGKLRGFAKITRDLTERKRVEDELQRSQEWLQTTLGSIGEGVIATDAAGNIKFLNPHAQALTGWSQEEARALHLDEVFKVKDRQTRQPVSSPFYRIISAGGVNGKTGETVLIARDGTEQVIIDNGAPILDAKRQIQGVVVVFRKLS